MTVPSKFNAYDRYYEVRVYQRGPLASRPTDVLTFIASYRGHSQYVTDRPGRPGQDVLEQFTIADGHLHAAPDARRLPELERGLPARGGDHASGRSRAHDDRVLDSLSVARFRAVAERESRQIRHRMPIRQSERRFVHRTPIRSSDAGSSIGRRFVHRRSGMRAERGDGHGRNSQSDQASGLLAGGDGGGGRCRHRRALAGARGRPGGQRRTAGGGCRRGRFLQGHTLRRAPRGRPAVAAAPASGAVDRRAPGRGIRSGLHAGTVRPASGGGGHAPGRACRCGSRCPPAAAPARPRRRLEERLRRRLQVRPRRGCRPRIACI